MNRLKKTVSSLHGFSLIEVLLAIAVFGLTIVAVIGLLGPTAQQVRDLEDLKVVNTLPAPIREELNRLGFTYFVNDSLDDVQNFPVYLYAPADGSRVVAYDSQGGTSIATNQGGDVPLTAIEPRNRYFEIEITPGTGNLEYNDGDAYVAMNVEISWPNNLPTGPNAGDFETVDEDDRSTFEFPTAIVVGEPF